MSSRTHHSPAAQAMHDQTAAAAREATQLLAATAEHLGAQLDYRAPSEPVRRLIRRLADRALRGNLGLCDHLNAGPAPMWWLVWRPSKLRCRTCAAHAIDAVRGTREDAICDACRRHSGGRIWPGAVALPPVVVDLPPLLAAAGPITVVFGLCARCHHAAGLDHPNQREESA